MEELACIGFFLRNKISSALWANNTPPSFGSIHFRERAIEIGSLNSISTEISDSKTKKRICRNEVDRESENDKRCHDFSRPQSSARSFTLHFFFFGRLLRCFELTWTKYKTIKLIWHEPFSAVGPRSFVLFNFGSVSQKRTLNIGSPASIHLMNTAG